MNKNPLTTSSAVFEHNLAEVEVYLYEARFNQLNPAELAVSTHEIGHGIARNMSYLNRATPITSLTGLRLVSLYPIDVCHGQWLYQQQKYDYTLYPLDKILLSTSHQSDRKALQKLLKGQIYRTLLNRLGDQYVINDKSTHIEILAKTPSLLQSTIGLEIFLTLLLDVDILTSGDAVVYFDLKHKITLPTDKNMHWIAQQRPEWLPFIKQVTPFVGASNTYEFVEICHDMTPRSLIPGMSISFIDYQLSKGNILASQVSEYEKSCIVKTTNGKTVIFHIGALLSPLVTLESLSTLDFTFIRNSLPKLRFASDKRFDTIYKVVNKLNFSQINFPMAGHLRLDRPVESLTCTRFEKRSISPIFLFGNNRRGNNAKQVLTHGAYKGCTRNYFIPVIFMPNLSQKELLKPKIAHYMLAFKQQLDVVCPADDMPRHSRLEFCHSMDDFYQLVNQLEVDSLKAMMLVLNADNNEQSYVTIRNHLFSRGIAHQFMNLNHQKYDDYYWSNLAAGVFSKAGGILSKMINIPGPHQLFIGIDLGGQHLRAVGSAMLMTADGSLLGWTLNDPQNGERLSDKILKSLIDKSIQQFQEVYGFKPDHICIHRDGLFNENMQIISDLEVLHNCKIDVLEIIKSGAPRTYRNLGKNNAEQGDVFFTCNAKEAILTPHSIGKMAATPQNIRVRQRYGESDLLMMIDQIILLTHIHGSSLFRSTRLPAPVHHSHNFATLLQKQDLNAISLMDRLCPIYL